MQWTVEVNLQRDAKLIKAKTIPIDHDVIVGEPVIVDMRSDKKKSKKVTKPKKKKS